MTADKLRDRLTFQSRADLSEDSPPGDGAGNFEGAWEDRFSLYAGLRALRGGEDVQAARLQGRQPYAVTIRFSTQAAQIVPDWRAVHADGRIFNIRAIADPDGRRAYLELLCEAGVAT